MKPEKLEYLKKKYEEKLNPPKMQMRPCRPAGEGEWEDPERALPWEAESLKMLALRWEGCLAISPMKNGSFLSCCYAW